MKNKHIDWMYNKSKRNACPYKKPEYYSEEEVAEVVRRFEAFQIRTQGQLLALLDSIEPIDWQDITPEAVKQCMEIQADLKQMLLRENTNV